MEDIRHVIKLRLLKSSLLCGLTKVLGVWTDMVPFPQWLDNSLTWPLQAISQMKNSLIFLYLAC